ncbi:endonuclease-reverse transcriptase [Elysia marginata]|uniref:Endonuclease-reverse transcriptase n=1 Tax=Elysia marginata TaxID=1093978 RepID=A0AAV4FYE1_9GAST|nr:endonuclease-reverse transcriptase [Elysia marginata]
MLPLQHTEQKDKYVKTAARSKKKTFLEDQASEAQEAAYRGDTQILYRITRDLSRANSIQPSTVKDEHGKLIAKLEDQCARLANHFQTILNRLDPEMPAHIQGKEKEKRNEERSYQMFKIEKAIAKSESNRATGEDRITVDRLKEDPSLSAKCLFNKVWSKEKVPNDCNKGILIKLSKKVDLYQYKSWRGIKLLSVPGKILNTSGS